MDFLHLKHLFLALILLAAAAVPGLAEEVAIDEEEEVPLSAEDYYIASQVAISDGDDLMAIDLLEAGIEELVENGSSVEGGIILTGLSLETGLGEVYASIQNYEEAFEHFEIAIDAYDEAIKAGDIIPEVVEDVAAMLASRAMMAYAKELQDFNEEKALEMYERAVTLNDGLWLGHARMGRFLDNIGEYEKAIDAYGKAFEVLNTHENPTDTFDDEEGKNMTLSHLQMAIAVSSCDYKGTIEPQAPLQCKPFAIEALKIAVQFDPNNMPAKQMLGMVEADGDVTPEDLHYTAFFDDFAIEFDEKLAGTLEYQAPNMLRRGLNEALGGEEFVEIFPVVLDAGCGTGLSGLQFRNISKHLIGVDLSEAMIEAGKKARPDLYDEIIVGDLVEVIEAKKPIDLVVAVDTFNYFGNMDPLFVALKNGLGDNGFAVFMVEHALPHDESILDQTKPGWTYQVTQAMRFAHAKGYVVEVAKKHGLTVIYRGSVDGFRQEIDHDVPGEMFVLQKKPQKGTTNKKDEL